MKNDDAPLVSVVVVSWNGMEITRRCLVSILGQDYRPKEVIAVDNGSQEDIRGMVTGEFPAVRLIGLDKNTGFAGGYNRGIEAANGKYVAVINNDAVASPQWLSLMVDAAEKDEHIGSVASMIIDGNRPGVLDSCGVGIALDGMSRQAMRGGPVPVLNEPVEVLLPSGCACLYRMEALKSTGLFDESFFAYCEDTDLGLRLRWAGYRAVAAPGAEVTHYYSMTAGKFSLNKVFWVERNHVWVAVKNFPAVLLPVVPCATVWRYVVQVYALATRSAALDGFIGHAGLLRIIKTMFHANLAAIAGIPIMLRKRAECVSGGSLSSFHMLRTILKFRLSMYEIIGGGARHAGQ